MARTQRRSIAMREARANLREPIDIRRLQLVRPVATYAVDAKVVREDENDFGPFFAALIIVL
jgi:hypothetical protein